MKITCNRKHLADALTWVTQVASAKPVMPALAGVKIVATEDEVEVSAFDYESYHHAQVDAVVGEPGAVLVPAFVLRDVVAGARTDDVTLSSDGSKLTVTAGRAVYTLALLVLEDHPAGPSMPPQVGIIDADQLAEVVRAGAHAASHDHTLAVLTSVNLEAGRDELRAQTTDRYRAVTVTRGWNGQPFTAKPVHHMLAAAAKGLTGPVHVHADANSLGLAAAGRTVVVRLLDAEFPKIASLYPSEDLITATVTVDGSALRAALKRIRAAGDSTVVLHVTHDGIELTLDGGDHAGCEVLDATADQPIGPVGVNGTYLAEAVCDGPVRLRFTVPTRPFLIEDPERPDVAQLLMPIRLAN